MLALQPLIWGIYGIIHFTAVLPAILPDERPTFVLIKAIRALTGMGVACVLVPTLVRRDGTARGNWWLLSAAVVGGGFLWMLADRAVLVSIAAVVGVDIPWNRFPRGVDLDYHFVMLAWVTAHIGFLLHRESGVHREQSLRHELAAESARADLVAAQLSPHFLFNALNTIRSLAAEDPTRTRDVVTRLASFLRRVLAVGPARPVTFGEELDLARDYLAVEHARFESALNVVIDVNAATLRVRVPPFILQPLLENAIRHGTRDESGVLHVVLRASREGNSVSIRVENAGALPAVAPREGVGLRLTRARLARHAAASHVFTLTGDQRIVTAEIRIPVSSDDHAVES